VQGSLPLPGADGDLPRGAWVQPLLPGRAGRVRQRRRRRCAGGHDGVAAGRRRADGDVGPHAPVVGLHLAHGHQAAAAGPLLAAHHQRVRRDARRRPGHPRRLAAGRRLQLHRPVRIILLHHLIS
jgi:hypothetical protein